MKLPTYIPWPKPPASLKKQLTDPDTYTTAEWSFTSPIGDMICIGFCTGCTITYLAKLDIENARLLEESLREYLKTDTEPMEKAAASTGL